MKLKLKVMVASGDSNDETLKLLGDKTLGHTWLPPTDKFVFRINVNLSGKKRGVRVAKDLTPDDIPRLSSLTFTRRSLHGFVMAQYPSDDYHNNHIVLHICCRLISKLCCL